MSFQPSARHRFSWEVRPSFSVSQNAERSQLLTIMKEKFGCGSIRPDRSDRTLKYEVRNIKELVEKILPHFRKFPILTSKQEDFERFDAICQLVHQGKHLDLDGFKEVVRLAMEMNPSGKRKYSASEILTSLVSDERIVYATGNCGTS